MSQGSSLRISLAALAALLCLLMGAEAVLGRWQREDVVDISLDPGHSSWDVGATGAGLREFELTLDISERVRHRLEAVGYRVRLTREDNRRVAPSVPTDPTEATRVEQYARHAAAGSARAYLSIHFNGHPNRQLRGTETYYNRDNYGEESLQLARLVHQETVAALAGAGYAPVDRGVREDLTAGKPYGHFFSLRGPFPSALVEVLFLSNEADATRLLDPAIRDAIAEGIAAGVAAYLSQLPG